jgi:hypothetical protein
MPGAPAPAPIASPHAPGIPPAAGQAERSASGAASAPPGPAGEIAPAPAVTATEPPGQPARPAPAPEAGALAAPPLAAPPLAATSAALARGDVPPEEAALLLSALSALRRDADPARARALLAEHAAGFPNSVLRQEVALAEIEAMLVGGERAAALQRLERLPLPEMPRSRTLSLVRGELRLEAGRCAQAASDLRAADAGLDDAIAERALRGLWICAARASQAEAERALLREALRRFPRGRWSATYRERLEAGGGAP